MREWGVQYVMWAQVRGHRGRVEERSDVLQCMRRGGYIYCTVCSTILQFCVYRVTRR